MAIQQEQQQQFPGHATVEQVNRQRNEYQHGNSVLPPASQEPPKDHYKLGPRAFRQFGDLIWAPIGWMPCNLSTGRHPEGVVACRRQSLGVTKLEPIPANKMHAPFVVTEQEKAEKEWMAHATPMFYTLIEPFNETGESLIFQINEVRQAITRLRMQEESQTYWATLYLNYFDNREWLFKRIKMMWTEYIDDPDSPAETKKQKMVLSDPYGLFCI